MTREALSGLAQSRGRCEDDYAHTANDAREGGAQSRRVMSLPWQTRLRLRPAAELLVDALEGVRRPERLPLRGREAQNKLGGNGPSRLRTLIVPE